MHDNIIVFDPGDNPKTIPPEDLEPLFDGALTIPPDDLEPLEGKGDEDAELAVMIERDELLGRRDNVRRVIESVYLNDVVEEASEQASEQVMGVKEVLEEVHASTSGGVSDRKPAKEVIDVGMTDEYEVLPNVDFNLTTLKAMRGASQEENDDEASQASA